MTVHAVTALLRDRLGIDPASLGAGVVEQAIAVRMRARGCDDSAAYASHLAIDEEEFQSLTEELMVPETWFFRGGIELFRHLAALIRNTRRAATSRTPFRVLSAPCSSGEEAYSLVIALVEAGVPPEVCTIDGVDVSRLALEKARTGHYREFSFRQTDTALRERYFRRVESEWEVVAAVRAAVRFRQGNLMEQLALAGEQSYDLIFCRNLLIYLHAAARAQILDNLARLLAPEGMLCMGHAEPIQFHDARFASVPPERFMLFRQGPASQPLVSDEPRTTAHAAPAPVVTRPPTVVRTPLLPVDEGTLARARRLADDGQIDAALATCTVHLERAGPSAAAYALLGILRQARHEPEEAMRSFEKALYLEPEHGEALTHLMLLCQQLGDAGRAAILRGRLERTRSGAKA
jgi:chemotaxis protein methyltransferase WspC